jgi:hypothetical protein
VKMLSHQVSVLHRHGYGVLAKKRLEQPDRLCAGRTAMQNNAGGRSIETGHQHGER